MADLEKNNVEALLTKLHTVLSFAFIPSYTSLYFIMYFCYFGGASNQTPSLDRSLKTKFHIGFLVLPISSLKMTLNLDNIPSITY